MFQCFILLKETA